MAVRTGYVRVTTNRPEVSVQYICLGPGETWSLYQPAGNVCVFRFDDSRDGEIDTLVAVINRLNNVDSEIKVTTWWWLDGVKTERVDECYYTDTLLISARQSILNPQPGGNNE